ncbi:protein FAM83F [Mugil cephalus]|uniref:protein FAM83F n=1 Tax=Mugil cephalus TaxID=48193 RepID=UPI001FB635B0|nr:protein FAM83F [Mugil cephalus]
MAESQLMCMEDGQIGAKVPESKPEFYYSEEQRAAIEELVKNGDGAFKTRLKEDNVKDFLAAREVKLLLNTFRKYDLKDDSDSSGGDKAAEPVASAGAGVEADSGVHSTYWPQMSDTEVPPLDIGWPNSGFKGVTRVAVHTHPPKDNGPHIKEVVRRLIQQASKVIAIVMDILTDVHILQDLMDAASRRSVAVYILLDEPGVPHFLDMCSRLQIGAQHLRKIRTRTLQGIGFNLSSGKFPGSLCNKYMLVDGDKIMFGSYSFSWCTSRMDRNMITVMTGQVVDFFDRDFRELYAISQKLNLYKEFHVTAPTAAPPVLSKVGSKRPALPATTSRFQVTLGDSRKADIQVPAHKYNNPKYLLAFADVPRPSGSLQEKGPNRGLVMADLLEGPRQASSVTMDRSNPLPSEASNESFRRHNGITQEKKGWAALKQRLSKRKPSTKPSVKISANTVPKETKQTENEDSSEVTVITPAKPSKKQSKRKSTPQQSVSTVLDNESVKSRPRGKACKIS